MRTVSNLYRALFTAAALVLAGSASAQETNLADAVLCEREADCLRALRGRVSRQGEALRLRMADGQWRVLRSNKKACDRNEVEKCVIRELRAHLPEQGLFVVEWTTSGDGGSEVISAATGQVATLDTMPEFSPSGRWFASVDPDELNDRQYDIGIWSVEDGEITQVFSYIRSGSEYEAWEFQGWDGDDRIKLRVTRPNAAPVDTEAVRTDAGWMLKRP